jgi:adenosine deaminase
MSRLEYMQTVLDEVETYPANKAAVIVSIDRRMEDVVVGECIHVATTLKTNGRRVVGVDLCGDPLVSVQRFRIMLRYWGVY